MPLWGNSNTKAKAPKFKVIEADTAGNASRGNNTAFNNTSVGVFHPGQAKGVFGANATQVAAASKKNIDHTGWHLVRQGTGPVKSLTITAGGTGFANTDTIKVAVVGTGTVNAAATLVTNATGGITTVTISTPGGGFTNASSATVSFANSTGGASGGSAATLTPVFGGRAGRLHYECLVAGSMTGSPPATLP